MSLHPIETRIVPLTRYRTLVTGRGQSITLGGSARPIAVTQVTTGLTGRSGAGVPGATGDLHYTHIQGTAAAEWLVVHGLGKFPSVTVVDSAGDQVDGDVTFIDLNSLRIVFSAAFSGSAYLN